MKKNNELKDFGTRETGFKVPDNYFPDFEKRMNSLIDQEMSASTVTPKVTFKQMIRPWLYLAASFVAFVLMFQMLMTVTSTSRNSVLDLSASNVDELMEEDVFYSRLNDYEIYESLYADNVESDL